MPIRQSYIYFKHRAETSSDINQSSNPRQPMSIFTLWAQAKYIRVFDFSPRFYSASPHKRTASEYFFGDFIASDFTNFVSFQCFKCQSFVTRSLFKCNQVSVLGSSLFICPCLPYSPHHLEWGWKTEARHDLANFFYLFWLEGCRLNWNDLEWIILFHFSWLGLGCLRMVDGYLPMMRSSVLLGFRVEWFGSIYLHMGTYTLGPH